MLEPLTAAHTASGDVTVTATVGAFAAPVVFRVWTVGSVAMQASDTALGLVCGSLYQSADLYATATLSHAPSGASVAGVDVTRHTLFSVVSGSATIGGGGGGNVITGTGAGAVSVAAGTTGATLSLTVGGSVAVTAIDAVAVTAMAMGVEGSRTDAFESSRSFSVTAAVEQSLSAEGDAARVLTYARFGDGTARYQASGIAVTSTDEAFVVLEGEMTIEFRDGSVDLQAGEMFVVPRGVEHKPMATEECRVMVIEPRGVILISNHKRPKRYIAHCSSDSLWQLNHSKQHNL